MVTNMYLNTDDTNKMRLHAIVDAFVSANSELLNGKVTANNILNSSHLREAIIDEFCKTEQGRGFDAADLKRAANIIESENVVEKLRSLNLSPEVESDVLHQLSFDRDNSERFLNGDIAEATKIVEDILANAPTSEYEKDRRFFDTIYNAESKDRFAGTKLTSKEYLEKLIAEQESLDAKTSQVKSGRGR